MEELISRVRKLSDKDENQDLNEQQKLVKSVQQLLKPNIVLRDYQCVGVQWLISRHQLGISAILGDEMGLGKTLQTIALLAYLTSQKHISPHLVICPLSILDNWDSEIKKFSNLKALIYRGERSKREEIQVEIQEYAERHMSSISRLNPKLNFDVLVTTYDLLLNDFLFFQKFQWQCTLFDEGHRFKNPEGALYNLVNTELKSKYSVLISGTPVQNNLKELWSLLHLLNPKIFSDQEMFVEYFERLDQKRSDQLHKLLAPFLLRREKDQVQLHLPEKREFQIFAPMTAMQKQFYRWILARDYQALQTKTSTKTKLSNILMQLRKCANHPYLFDGAEPTFDGEYVLGEHLVQNSGKLMLLDKLLVRLKKEGHRVLIFSQMTAMLDILQDYLQLRSYTYERLDGSVRGDERFLAIKNFAEQDPFVFLLSTRAGGQGLNLTSADTVVFFDSDWNPQLDLQAQARAHRIGQEKEVTVVRLVTQYSVEELILRRARQKLLLTQKVINEGHFAHDSKVEELARNRNDLEEIISFGLNQILEGEDDLEINDSDLDLIFGGKSAASGGATGPTRVVALDQKSRPSKPDKSKKKSKHDFEEEEEAGMYVFEGVDYAKETRQQDQDALARLIQESKQVQNTASADPTARSLSSGRSLRNRALEEPDPEQLLAIKKKKAEAALQRKLKKWEQNNYISKAISLRESTLRLSGGMQFDDNEINYVSGDASHPSFGDPELPVLILNLVDNSGNWPDAGFFSSLSQLSQDIEDSYEQAGKNKDLEMGTVHLILINDKLSNNNNDDNINNEELFNEDPTVPSSRSLYVANLVVQKRTPSKLHPISLEHFTQALEKVCQTAKDLRASVHLPRLGTPSHGVSWYTLERLVKSNLVFKGITTFVYYYKKPRAAAAVRRNQSSFRSGSLNINSQPSSPAKLTSTPTKPKKFASVFNTFYGNPPSGNSASLSLLSNNSAPSSLEILHSPTSSRIEKGQQLEKQNGPNVRYLLQDWAPLFKNKIFAFLNINNDIRSDIERFVLAHGGIVGGLSQQTTHVVIDPKNPSPLQKTLQSRGLGMVELDLLRKAIREKVSLEEVF